MRIDNNETMKMYSPEYVKNVAQANKKAAADNAANEKTVGDDVDISKEGKSLLVTGKEKAERFRHQIRFVHLVIFRRFRQSIRLKTCLKWI